MGITPVEFDFLKAALDSGHFATVKTVLEFGESNTHNLDMRQAIPALVPEGEVREAALAAAEAARANDRPGYPWARQLYGLIFKGAEYTAIDLDPKPPFVIQQDLNEPFDLGRRFDLCINNGTSEHIFNQANFYKAMHDHTRVGGLMIHWTPMFGWTGHGFYNVQPGFFEDLAAANGYDIITLYAGEVLRQHAHLRLSPWSPRRLRLSPQSLRRAVRRVTVDVWQLVVPKGPVERDALAMVMMRKTAERPFRHPMQGSYKHLSKYKVA